jgi:hypothetical protein
MFCVVNKKDLLFPDPMMTTSSQESRGQRGLLALVCEGDPVLGQQQQDELSWLAHGTESIYVPVCHPIHWRLGDPVFLLRLVHGAAMAWKPSMMRVTNRKSRRP